MSQIDLMKESADLLEEHAMASDLTGKSNSLRQVSLPSGHPKNVTTSKRQLGHFGVGIKQMAAEGLKQADAVQTSVKFVPTDWGAGGL